MEDRLDKREGLRPALGRHLPLPRTPRLPCRSAPKLRNGLSGGGTVYPLGAPTETRPASPYTSSDQLG